MAFSSSIVSRLVGVPLVAITCVALLFGIFSELNGERHAHYTEFVAEATRQAAQTVRFDKELVTTHSEVRQSLLWLSNQGDGVTAAQVAAQFEMSFAKTLRAFEALKTPDALSRGELTIIAQIEAALTRYRDDTRNVLDLLDVDIAMSTLLMTRAEQSFSELVTATHQLVQLQNTELDRNSTELMTEIMNARAAGILISFLALVASLLGTWWYTRRFTSPIRQLTEGMVAIREGGRHAVEPSTLNRRDEIGAMARAFLALEEERDESRRALEQANSRLESDVSARTRELAATNVELQAQIHERQLAVNALRRSELEYRNILDGSLQGVFMHVDGELRYVNQAFADILGYDNPSDIVSVSSIFDHIAPHDVPRLDGYKQARIRGESPPGTYEYDVVRKDGSLRRLVNSVRIVEWQGEEVVQCFTFDITEQEHARRALEKARDAAMKTARAKSEFLANMSHEIRTPMNGVLGALTLLEDTTLDEEQRKFTDIARVSGKALLSLIDDILDFSKVEAGQMQLEQIGFSPREVVEDVIAMCAERALERNIKLGCAESDRAPPRLVGDPNRLRQVITNLVSNAVKFTMEGSVTIRMNVCSTVESAHNARTGAADTYCIQVVDTGVGIAEDALERIFRPFLQEDGSTTRKFGGTGLGLAICQKLVQGMGGSIGVESRQRVGSIFTVKLPLREPERADPDITQLEQLRAAVSGPNQEGLHALRQILGRHFQVQLDVRDGSAPIQLPAPGGRNPNFHIQALDGITDEALATAARNAVPGARRLILCTPAAVEPERLAAHFEGEIPTICTYPLRLRGLRDLLKRELNSTRDSGEEQRAPAPSSDASSLGMHVLVVDDVAVNRVLATRMLEKLGATHSSATNGEEAVEAVRNAHFDAVLMDCQMPVMDGYEATRVIRALPGPARSTPVIALTAHAIKGDDDQCFAAGMDDYLTKPLSIDLLRSRLQHWKTHREAAA